jgi:hypothetical protein
MIVMMVMMMMMMKAKAVVINNDFSQFTFCLISRLKLWWQR